MSDYSDYSDYSTSKRLLAINIWQITYFQNVLLIVDKQTQHH